MARVSRVRKKEAPAAMEARTYKTALYVRLSVLDGGKKDGGTVETQEAILRGFIKGKPELVPVSVYTDNGESGVNFKRDEFERLMEDVRRGRVDCIIVKDLSRFGRNYIEAGEYLEKVFPFLGVRFIAVNDGYDSLAPSSSASLSLHLKNLVNDVYARDISAKVSPVLRGKQERGEFIGAWAAYGYLKSLEDRHRIVADPKAAPVVRDMFAWRAEGLSYKNIARRLTEKKIPSPSQYRYEMGLVKKPRFADMPWKAAAVKHILENEVYLGHIVQGRVRESLSQGQKRTSLPREEWLVVKDTHEAIIDPITFEAVRRFNQQRAEEFQAKQQRFSEVGNTENILKGLVRCGTCETKLIRYKNVRENKHKKPRFHVWYNYICRIHAADPAACAFLSVPERLLLEAVSRAVKMQIMLAADMEGLLAAAAPKSLEQEEKERLERQMIQAGQELQKTIRHRESLYDDYAGQLMTEQDYIYAQERYKEREAALKGRMERLRQSCESIRREAGKENPWLESLLSFREQTELTRCMAVELIDRITVYEDGSLHIAFRFQDEYEALKNRLLPEKEADHG